MTKGQWLTPDIAPPSATWERRVLIPADTAYVALVSGALLDLTYASSYEQYGAATPDEVAEAFSVMYSAFTQQTEEPPFWGDDDDVDGLPQAPWYDQLADWIIEGFLAISGFPTAAIVYSTSVPKIRLALRAGNFGALFRILLDNLELYTGDSYAPIQQIIGHTLDLEGFAVANDLGPGPWELRIEHLGPGPNIPEGNTAYLEVVRQRITADMPIQFRQTTPNLIEFSQDGGATWETAADLRLQTAVNTDVFVYDDDGTPVAFHADTGEIWAVNGANTEMANFHAKNLYSTGRLAVNGAPATVPANFKVAADQILFIANGSFYGLDAGIGLIGVNLDNNAYRKLALAGETVVMQNVSGTGGVGVGVGSPTARLHIGAGVDASGGAPFKMESGALLTTPEGGALEYDGDHLYFTDSAGTRHTLV